MSVGASPYVRRLNYFVPSDCVLFILHRVWDSSVSRSTVIIDTVNSLLVRRDKLTKGGKHTPWKTLWKLVSAMLRITLQSTDENPAASCQKSNCGSQDHIGGLNGLTFAGTPGSVNSIFQIRTETINWIPVAHPQNHQTILASPFPDNVPKAFCLGYHWMLVCRQHSEPFVPRICSLCILFELGPELGVNWRSLRSSAETRSLRQRDANPSKKSKTWRPLAQIYYSLM